MLCLGVWVWHGLVFRVGHKAVFTVGRKVMFWVWKGVMFLDGLMFRVSHCFGLSVGDM